MALWLGLWAEYVAEFDSIRCAELSGSMNVLDMETRRDLQEQTVALLAVEVVW